MVKVHPITRQRYTHARHCGDIMLDAEGPEALSTEKLIIIGGWKDYTGSGGIPTKQQMFAAGHADKLWASDAWIEGARLKQLNSLGDTEDTTRLRRKKIYIDLTGQ